MCLYCICVEDILKVAPWGVQVFKNALKLILVQVYAPSNDSEYHEYTKWFLSINTASGGDR